MVIDIEIILIMEPSSEEKRAEEEARELIKLHASLIYKTTA